VFPAHLTDVFLLSTPQQNRHPACPGVPWERSAAQIYRPTQRLWRGVEGPRRRLSSPCRSELFNHQSPTTGSCCGTQLMAGHSTMLESSWFPAPGKVRGRFARCGLPRLKNSAEHRPTSIAGVLRLRATIAVSADESARRFAQDDGFVGGLKKEKRRVRCAEKAKKLKKSQTLGMTVLWEFRLKTS